MNDRYLFRGKRIDNGEWVIGWFCMTDPKPFTKKSYPAIICKETNFVETIEPETTGQCTEVEDKNKRLIFKGDIVNYDLLGEPYIGIVKYGKFVQDGSGGEYGGSDCLGFYIERIKVVLREWEDGDDVEWREKDYQKTVSILEAEKIEIIGNIHDNPDLLNNN